MEFHLAQPDQGMEWLQFIASIIGSVAWPIAAFAIAWMFKRQISALIEKIRRLSWGDGAIELAEKLDKVETAVRSDPQLGQPIGPPVQDPQEDRFQRLLEISPAAAILDAWAPIGEAIDDLARRQGAYNALTPQPSPAVRAIEHLHRLGHISPSLFALLNELRVMRNLAAHTPDATVSDAVRFQSLARRAMAQLRLMHADEG